MMSRLRMQSKMANEVPRSLLVAPCFQQVPHYHLETTYPAVDWLGCLPTQLCRLSAFSKVDAGNTTQLSFSLPRISPLGYQPANQANGAAEFLGANPLLLFTVVCTSLPPQTQHAVQNLLDGLSPYEYASPT